MAPVVPLGGFTAGPAGIENTKGDDAEACCLSVFTGSVDIQLVLKKKMHTRIGRSTCIDINIAVQGPTTTAAASLQRGGG